VRKYISVKTNFLSLVRTLLILFFSWERSISDTLSSTPLRRWPLNILLAAIYRFQKSLWGASSLIRVTQWSIGRFESLGLQPSFLLTLMDWAISQKNFLSSLSCDCVFTPPLSCQTTTVPAAYWLTPTLAFSVRRQTCAFAIRIAVDPAMTGFSNRTASHNIVCSPWWSLMEWWMSNTCNSKQASGLLNRSLIAMKCSSRGS